MWLVVTLGSPCALNIASDASRMRWRVCRAIVEVRSAAEFLHQVHVFLHRLVLARTGQLGPGLVLGGAHEVEETGLGAADVAFRALLVEGVQPEEGVVVRSLGQ